jgi:murein L,D-transpeptidase YcbB/YkuD
MSFVPQLYTSAGKLFFVKFLSCCVFFLLISATTGHGRPADVEISKAMAKYLVCSPLEQLQIEKQLPILATEELCLYTIYDKTGTDPLWVTANGPTEHGTIILGYLRESYRHGLDPDEYKVDRILELWDAADPDALARLETLLTYNLVKYVHDISYGQLKPLASDPVLFAEAGNIDFNPLRTIEHILATSDLDQFLAGLPPRHYHYTALKAALEHYRNIAESGGWSSIPQGPSLRPGDTDARIILVRKRLQVTDHPAGTALDTNSIHYDPLLERTVQAFQRRHGLLVDGIIGANTLAAMNISAAEKVASIRLNMARWRWQDHDLGAQYLLTNIAAFTVKAFQGEDIILDMPVIVGKQQHQTPVFSSKIKYLDFNPFWNIPTSIAQNEELPRLRKNPNHLVDRHIRLFSSWQSDAVELDSTVIDWHNVSRGRMAGYKLRQEPGPWNALGKIKFSFPNRYSVYMHGTPAQNLFSRTQRDFSHGCIRISDPLALAIFVLETQSDDWPREKIEEIYQQELRKVIRLSSPLAVHITYQTAWVDKSGTVHFNRDIYLRDAALHNALL